MGGALFFVSVFQFFSQPLRAETKQQLEERFRQSFNQMIGDSSNDAQAARAAGCPVVLVTYGYNHGEPVRAVDADGFVDSLADIALANIR